MKLTTGILAITITMTAGAGLSLKAAAQNPDAIDNARSIAKSLQQKQDHDTNTALDAAGVGTASKPAPGAPAPAVKPAVIPGAKPAASATSSASPSMAAAKPAAAPETGTKTASAAENKLQHVSVMQQGDNILIEMSASGAVTPRVSKLSAPARVLVELPGTIATVAQNHITVGTAGIKDVRIGVNAKTPPTTSVVVDLDKACAYELTPGSSDKLVLTLHTAGGVPVVAKSTPAPTITTKTPATKTPAPAPQPPVVAKNAAPAAKPQTAAKTSAAQPQTAAKNSAPAPATASPSKTQPTTAKATKPEVAKTAVVAAAAGAAAATTVKSAEKPQTANAKATATATAKDTKPAAPAASAPAAETAKTAEAAKPKPEDKKWAMSGKRDPFFSPVVQQNGSGCSTGKKCLEIGNINLRGVVKSDTGFIAVVTNNLNKAYFLRENDPVFNGYVVKITGDSIVFQETVEDKLGKPFTREVVKRIFTPAV
jgi:hypothetical protein